MTTLFFMGLSGVSGFILYFLGKEKYTLEKQINQIKFMKAKTPSELI